MHADKKVKKPAIRTKERTESVCSHTDINCL